ncbi:MAG: hypothetical protein ACMZI0_14015 [Symbiopectobacterium sp.]|uniref:hypothetical protein n=1 Tax=Symbiopectobacterium sp. TaxID=2952789 RepID=UPI0039EC6EEC
MQVNSIINVPIGNVDICNTKQDTKSNETLEQISTFSNTQENYTVKQSPSGSSDSQRSSLTAIREFFFRPSSTSQQKVTQDELTVMEEGKSLMLESNKLMQQTQRGSNHAFAATSSCGWKTIFGLGLLAGTSLTGGIWLWSRQQNSVISGDACPINDLSPFSTFSTPLAHMTPSTTESMLLTPETTLPSPKIEQPKRKSARGDFFKQTKVCDSSETRYKDCHFRNYAENNYYRSCFLYSEEKPCERPEDFNKSVTRVV